MLETSKKRLIFFFSLGTLSKIFLRKIFEEKLTNQSIRHDFVIIIIYTILNKKKAKADSLK